METNSEREASHQDPALGAPSISPWISIPDRRIICIEHPAVIRNVDKGLATIGGETALSKLAATNGGCGLQLRYRPDEPMQPPIESRTVPSNNVLLKVKIRRKKNKRNSDSEPLPTDETLLDKLKASDGKYTVEAVGVIDQIVRFRGMANYQWNTSNSPFVTKVKETLLKCNYDSIRNFEFNLEKGILNAETLPPPYFTAIHIPFTYNYRQNPAIKKALIDGRTSLLNVQAGPKTYTRMITFSEDLPERPPDLRAYEELDKITKECVDHLHKLFNERPVWTRRALYNNFPRHLHPSVRFSMAHVAYMYRSGPWRDTCVVYGVDPRLDQKYRMHQSIFFQIEMRKTQGQGKVKTSHIFDGKQLMHDGRCYQMCDITDPMLMRLINTKNIREKCDSQDGWYRASTMSKIKALMKAKVVALASGTPTPDSEYLSIIEAESEDEGQEAVRKEREAKKEKIDKSVKRKSTKNKRQVTSIEKPAEMPIESSKEADGNIGGDMEGEAIEGDWEEELAAPAPDQVVDEQVQKLMSAYLDKDGDLGFDQDELEEDFGILDSEEEDDGSGS